MATSAVVVPALTVRRPDGARNAGMWQCGAIAQPFVAATIFGILERFAKQVPSRTTRACGTACAAARTDRSVGQW
jgi:hypothetical protein